jgi:hypothetical protein
MLDTGGKNPTAQKAYEIIKARGCATIGEVAEALGITKHLAYSLVRALVTKRLVLPYRPHVGRDRIYCIPHVGDKLYGHHARLNVTGILCITLPIDLIEMLDSVATSTATTRSSLVRQALIHYLRINSGTNDLLKQHERQHKDEELDLIAPDR